MPRRLFSGHAEQAGLLHRLPAPLPVHLRRPAHAAEGAALGAQHRRIGRARRPAVVVGPAGRAAHDRRGPRSCCTRAGRRTASATPSSRETLAGPRGRLADRLRRRPSIPPTSRSATSARSAPPPSGWRCPAASTGSTSAATSWWSSTTRPAGCRPPTTRPAAHRRWPPTCWASGAPCAVPARGSSCTTCPAAPSRRSSTPTGRWPTTCAGPRTSPTTSAPPPRAMAAGAEPRRGVPRRARGGSAGGATSGPAARPARPRLPRGRPGASWPRRSRG